MGPILFPFALSGSVTSRTRTRPAASRAEPASQLGDDSRLTWAQWPAEARLLLGLVAIWCLAGLLILTSASWWVAAREMGDPAYYLKRQAIWMIPSWGLLWLAICTPLRRWLRLAGPAVLVGALLIAATLLAGTTVNGASRWLVIGPIQIQPSELVKPFIVLQGASLFAHWKRIGLDQKVLWLGIFSVLLLLILKQPNLSTAALTGLLLWALALAAGLPMLLMVGTAVAGGLIGTASILINEYQRIRVVSFLNPWQDAQGDGYQLVQSLLAIGSGGLLGEGFGLSTQKLQYLPIQSTDFIFAVFAEEFGYVGSLVALIFLLLFGFVGLRVALSSRSNQQRLVAIGCISLLVGQSILNIAVASGAMPTTGLPLPMVSYGGNSLLASLITAGLLIRCSLESAHGHAPPRKRQRRPDPPHTAGVNPAPIG
ncbi:FtsW/RodA/SpoVE family cell cycle protein [Synechococcus sp. CS-1324]|uniref:FtsW/RodA/SpoVE family cell cycle protein n=1 Tax=Synechococcus sp. CS-1324 TaxID=2847980 RepID=UPI000DB0709F|nr:FtsW/RodA/SpoVE family cell cycle protein [Synechococcus sp. CS-1324]PZV05696.1 MAG: cell division protein FtsW [Cyanobium sp.]